LLASALTLIDDSRATVALSHWQEALDVPTLERGTCCQMHPTVCGTGSSVVAVDVGVPRWADDAEEPSMLTPTFLKTNTCIVLVRPVACALREEEPWSVHSCAGGNYAIAIDDLYALEGAPLRPVAPIEHPLDVVEADGRSRACRIRSRARRIQASTEMTS
jgi:hypothetical protein